MTRTNIAANEMPAARPAGPHYTGAGAAVAHRLPRGAVRAAVLVAGLAAAAPGTAGAADVKVENYSNETVNVAVAYNKDFYGKVVQGWFQIKPNHTHTFRANNAADMYLRFERESGKEVTFDSYNTFRKFPAPDDRFLVTKEPDDAAIRVLQWGDSLQHSFNVPKGGKLPKGWADRRFFRVGPKDVTLEVRP